LKKIKVGIVNYLNTKPLLYGLQRPPIIDRIELIPAYPSKLADMLAANEIDIGLVPVAILPGLPSWYFASDYCIGTEGEIASVCLFSEVPMNEIKTVYLDYQSRSSVALLKWLMKEYWGIEPLIIQATDESYRGKIKGDTAGLVIGDRALQQRRISTFIYDLGSEWRSITGLPFVFATWVSTRPMPQEFIDMFNRANAMGLDHIDEIVSETAFEIYDLKKYYKIHLSYHLDERKKQGLDRFLREISQPLSINITHNP
jgi:chorismate dehydratase